jgi:hypothetical protein
LPLWNRDSHRSCVVHPGGHTPSDSQDKGFQQGRGCGKMHNARSQLHPPCNLQ